jgi:hypothetical protein
LASVAAVLAKERLPLDGIDVPGCLFWRFDTMQDVPLGFGGIELHGGDALLHAVVTLPPVCRCNIGSAIVTEFEIEAAIAGCGTVYLLAAGNGFFERLGHSAGDLADVPPAIRRSSRFAGVTGGRIPNPDMGTVMVKRLAPRPRR